jgi:CheY-like chemotaxis protein
VEILLARQKRVEALTIHPLTPEDQTRFTEAWRESKERLIVLLDSSMPGVDGEGVLRAVLQDRRLRRRHAVVFVSAIARLSRRLSLQRLILAFTIEVVAKPFDITDLEQAVDRARVKLM